MLHELKHRWALLLAAGIAAGCSAGAPGAPGPAPEPRGEVETPGDTAGLEYEFEGPPAVLGVIVPQTGSAYLRRYGDLILDGVQVAIDEHAAAGRRPIELVVLDDGGDAERDAALIAELERRGAVGVVGPLLPAGVAAAAAARIEEELVLVSPTASEPTRRPNAYSLNAGDTRGAEALAAYAAEAGLLNVALLYPSSPEHQRQAEAFRFAIEYLGGRVVAEVPYATGTTTFGTPLSEVIEARPQAVYVPAPPKDVRQIAPQIRYYGLDTLGVQVFGGEAWVTEELLRSEAGRHLEGVIATTPLLKESPELGWRAFVDRYEQTYRRSLDNPFPALGYDAARLILEGLGEGDAEAGEVAERLRSVRELRGATGVLSVTGGAVVRRPFVVRIEEGELRPAVPADTLSPSFPGAGWRDR